MNGLDYGNIIQNSQAAHMIKKIFQRVVLTSLKSISILLNIIIYSDKNLSLQSTWHTPNFSIQRLNYAFKIGLGIV
jgi:hypothetical protein